MLIGGVSSIAQIFSFFASLGFENAEDDTVGNFDDLTPAVRNRVAHFCGLLCVSVARVFVALESREYVGFQRVWWSREHTRCDGAERSVLLRLLDVTLVY